MKYILSILLLCSLFANGQTSLSFTTIPYSSTDFSKQHGKGAEFWNGANWNDVNAPTVPSGNTVPGIVYYRFNWVDIENATQGSYDWSLFDAKINAAIDQGSMFGFSIMNMCTACGLGALTYPSYLHNLMQSDPVVNNRDWQFGGVDWIPNWNSEYYLSRWEALLNATAAHINAGSRNGVAYKNAIYYIDIRGYGDFGEWHTYPWTNTEPTGRKVTIASLKRIIDAHTTAFPNFPAMVPMGAFDTQHDSQIPAEVGYYVLTKTYAWGQIGWRRDNLGDVGYGDWIEFNPASYDPGTGSVSLATLAMNKWKYAPVGGEPNNDLNSITAGGTQNAHFDLEPEVIKFHISHFGNGNYPVVNVSSQPGLSTNVRAASKRTGYRIEPTGGSMTTTLTANSNFSVTLNWKNSGVAPAYLKWKVQYALKNGGGATVATWYSSFTPTMFLPTVSDSVVTDLLPLGSVTPGTYSLTVKVMDSTGFRTPMELAITGRNADGSYNVRTGITVQAGNPNLTVNAGVDRSLSSGTTTVTTAGSFTTTDTVDLIVMWGESNIGGIASNAKALAGELLPRTNVKIYNHNASSFQDLDIGTNNNIGQYIERPDTSHGMELGLANQVDSGMFKNPVYLIKMGGSGSWIQQWLPGDARDLWGEYTPRLTAAIAALNTAGLKYRITVWSSIGLNDKFGQGTSAANYRTRMESFIASFRALYGSGIPFFLMDFFNTPSQTSWDWRSTLDAMAAADSKIRVVPAQGADYVDGSVHFDYAGMKLLAQRMTDSTLSYWNTSVSWTKVSGPAGGTITRPSRPVTPITGLNSGTYTYRLSVTANGTTLSDDVLITVAGAGGNAVPTANAGVDQTITLPTNQVTLSGSGTDPDGTITGYSWVKLTGGAATITSASSATTTVTGLLQGTYTFQLTVTDNGGATATDVVQIVVNAAPNLNSNAPVIFAYHAASTTSTSTVVNTLSGLPSGALLVLTLAQPDDNTVPNPSISSTPSLTWTKQVDAQAVSSGNAEIYTAVLTAGGSVSITTVWGPNRVSGVLYAITNYDPSPFGNNGLATSQTLPQANITTTKDSSLVIGAISDWNAIDGATTRVYRSAPVVETFYERNSVMYTAYHFYKFMGAAGTSTFGVTAPSGQASGTVLLEIKGITIVPNVRPMAPRRKFARLRFVVTN